MEKMSVKILNCMGAGRINKIYEISWYNFLMGKIGVLKYLQLIIFHLILKQSKATFFSDFELKCPKIKLR